MEKGREAMRNEELKLNSEGNRWAKGPKLNSKGAKTSKRIKHSIRYALAPNMRLALQM